MRPWWQGGDIPPLAERQFRPTEWGNKKAPDGSGAWMKTN
jgi:hypothetical protein